MSFLRRLLGGTSTGPRWYDCPRGYAVPIAGASYYKDAWQRAFGFGGKGDSVSAIAELAREPTNPKDPDAVKVLVGGHHLGHLPAEVAASWSPLLASKEAAGYRIGRRSWFGAARERDTTLRS